MAKEDEAVAAALTTLLRTVRDAEDLLVGFIDGDGAFDLNEPSTSQTRALAAMLVRLTSAQADGHRALREKHLAMARQAADDNPEWGFVAEART